MLIDRRASASSVGELSYPKPSPRALGRASLLARLNPPQSARPRAAVRPADLRTEPFCHPHPNDGSLAMIRKHVRPREMHASRIWPIRRAGHQTGLETHPPFAWLSPACAVS